MLGQRLTFGTLMIVAILALCWADAALGAIDLSATPLAGLLAQDMLPAGLIVLLILLALIALASVELAGILRNKGAHTAGWLLALAGGGGCVLAYLTPTSLDATTALALGGTLGGVTLLLALIYHTRAQQVEGAMLAGGAATLGLVYLGMLPAFYLAIRQQHGIWLVLGVVLIVKSCDIGAYFTGHAIGKHKLIVWLSPGKTWEGLIGGLVLAGLVATALTALANQQEALGRWIMLDGEPEFHATHVPLWLAPLAGMLLGGIGQLGDLIASLFKRDAGVKDSGSSIPGFGGMLDVLDSPLLAAPLAYWLLSMAV